MILVAGATGLVGGTICRTLAEQGKPVRGLVRATSDPAKLASLKSNGVELAQGDLKDRTSLDQACRGATAVISTASATISRQAGDSVQSVDLDGQRNLVDAAEAAAVKRFVYVSFRPKPNLDFPIQRAKQAVERRLETSGMVYSILQASCFMEVWLSPQLGFDVANAKAQVCGSGQNKISWVSFADVAQFAVASLDNPAAENATIPVGGPEALSALEVVRIFEEQTGRRFTVQHVREEDLWAQLGAATDPMQQTFAGLMLYNALGDEIDMRPVLEKFPIKLTSVRDYARRLAP